MNIDLSQMTEEEMLALNRQIVARLKFIRQYRAQTQMLKFNIGDRVSFQPDGRPMVTGTVTRHNTKSVSVVADSGHKWTVHPSLLTLVEKTMYSPPEQVDLLLDGKS